MKRLTTTMENLKYLYLFDIESSDSPKLHSLDIYLVRTTSANLIYVSMYIIKTESFRDAFLPIQPFYNPHK